MHVTILGGGGFRVPLIARQLAASGLPVTEVSLYDTDPGRLAVMAGVLAGDRQTGGLPVTIADGLDQALRGADIIFAALRPGGLDGRVSDERSALAAGVLGQETVGAGGLASAARTVPVADAIARRVADLAPDAWLISMTNPAGIVTEVMSAVLGPRVIGVCDSPVGLVRRACRACDIDPGPGLGTVTDRVNADYLGINHLGWLRGLRAARTGEAGGAWEAGEAFRAGGAWEASEAFGAGGAWEASEAFGAGGADGAGRADGAGGGRGADLLPGLLADPARLLLTEEGRLFGPDVLRSLGSIPNEYLYWYYAGAEALRDVLAAGRTRGEHVRGRQQEFYAAAAAALTAVSGTMVPPGTMVPLAGCGPEAAARLWQQANDERNRSYFAELRTGEQAGERDEADLAAGGYESVAVALAAALAGGPAAQLILNVPNQITVPALPPGLVLEVPCRVDAAGAVPLPVSAPTAHQLGLMSVVRGCERDIADAALLAARPAGPHAAARARDLALRAFATHPLVGSLGAARSLAAAVLDPASHHTQLSYRFTVIYEPRASRLQGRHSQRRPAAAPEPHWQLRSTKLRACTGRCREAPL